MYNWVIEVTEEEGGLTAGQQRMLQGAANGTWTSKCQMEHCSYYLVFCHSSTVMKRREYSKLGGKLNAGWEVWVSAVGEDKRVIKDGAPLDFISFCTFVGQCLTQNFYHGPKHMPTCEFQETNISFQNKIIKLLMLVITFANRLLYHNYLKRSLSSPLGEILRKKWILIYLVFPNLSHT